jgi:hypothetical protein
VIPGDANDDTPSDRKRKALDAVKKLTDIHDPDTGPPAARPPAGTPRARQQRTTQRTN